MKNFFQRYYPQNIILLLYVEFVTYINVFAFICPYIILKLSNLAILNKIANHILTFYKLCAHGQNFIIKYIYKSQIYVLGYELMENYDKDFSTKIFVQNHIMEHDFLFASVIFGDYYVSPNINTKAITLKQIYAILPGLCLISYLLGGKPLSKNKALQHMSNIKLNPSDILIIYPEGQLLHTKTKLLSDNYCEKNNITIFNNVTCPKTTGIKILHSNVKIDNIYILTVKYFDILKSNMMRKTILNTKFPKNTFIQITKHKVSDSIETDIMNIYRKMDSILDLPLDINNIHNYENVIKIKLTSIDICSFMLNITIFIILINILYYNIWFRYVYLIQTIIYYIWLYFV